MRHRFDRWGESLTRVSVVRRHVRRVQAFLSIIHRVGIRRQKGTLWQREEEGRRRRKWTTKEERESKRRVEKKGKVRQLITRQISIKKRNNGCNYAAFEM